MRLREHVRLFVGRPGYIITLFVRGTGALSQRGTLKIQYPFKGARPLPENG